MKRFLSWILLAACASACSDTLYENKGFDGELKRAKTSGATDLSQWNGWNVCGAMKRGSQLVIAANSIDYNAVRVDLESASCWALFAGKAEGQDYVPEMVSFNTHANRVSMLDFRAGRLVESTVAPLSRSGGEPAETVIALPSGKQHLAAVHGDGFVLATGVYEEGRYLLYSLHDGRARYFLSYPTHPAYPSLREETKAMLHGSSVLRLRPDERAFACADMYSGTLDFCRLAGDTVERVKTVVLHYPKVEISERDVPCVAYRRDNVFGFIDMAVTPHGVYALYSGKTYESTGVRTFESRMILSYDWDGNLLGTYEVDNDLISLTHDIDENCLYGVTPCRDNRLVKIEL